ncbi:MAG: hypothetical protein IJD45_05185 [Clostridia bacterium]|nr:hypothetical protein [Clostridia bacterium]
MKSTNNWDDITILCEAYTAALKEVLLEKRLGEKIVIVGEVSAKDCVNGYSVDIKRVK